MGTLKRSLLGAVVVTADEPTTNEDKRLCAQPMIFGAM
jgi:hypothetical protein